MFAQKVDMRSRANMINFLISHFRYYTMNPWNRLTSYANNIKLHNLPIPSELVNKAYDFISAECPDYSFAVNDRISDFTQKTGYTAGFNGRSAGYIVLYDTKLDDCRTILAHSIDDYEDFADWSIDEIRDRVKLIQSFDKLCDDILDIFLYYLKNTEIKTVRIMKPETRIIAELTT